MIKKVLSFFNKNKGEKATGALQEVVSNLRNYTYEAVCGAVDPNKSFPNSYRIPDENTGTQKSQGEVCCCVAEVISQISEELWKRELNSQQEFSEGYAYATLRDDGFLGKGLYPESAVNYWMKKGIPLKKYFDIVDEMPDIKQEISNFDDLQKEAENFRISGYVTLGTTKSTRVNEVKDALMTYNYGVLGVSHEYYRGGSHCIQIVGWNDTKGSYIIKNSWGADWGDNGYGELPYEQLNLAILPLLQPLELPFKDVSKEEWYYKYIKNAYFSGIMNGTSETTFEPDKYMTRAEVATLVSNLMKQIDENNKKINELLQYKIDKK